MISLRRALFLTVALAVPSISRAQSSDAELDSVFERREVMIPMRDGVGLFTVILTPRNRTDSLPILF